MTTGPAGSSGESIDVLAKERGCTRERIRHRLKRLDEVRTVIALQAQLDEARAALALMDHYGVIIRDDDGKHMSVPLQLYEAMRRAICKPGGEIVADAKLPSAKPGSLHRSR